MKVNKSMEKMSDVLKAVSLCGFTNPNAPQREKDLAIALYYAQLAWNEANGEPVDDASIKRVRKQMGIAKKLPSSFGTPDANELLKQMVRFKQKHFPNDSRIILACLFEDERLQVQWRD